jgi:hypothetical protein
MARTKTDDFIMTGMPTWLIPPKTHVGPPYTEAQLEKVFEWLSEGKTLTSLYRSDPAMPSPGELMRYLHKHPRLLDDYFRARSIGMELLNDETRDTLNGEINEMEDLDRTRERIKHSRWLAAVYNPQRYGEKRQIDITNKLDISEALAAAEARRQEHIESSRRPLLIEHDDD